MIGKILLYRIEEGTGIILSKDSKKYSFEVMEWNDFDNMPETGMTVEFQMLDKKITSIKKVTSKNDDSSIDENEKIEKELTEEEKAFGTIDLQALSANCVAEGTMDKTLDLFFKDLNDTVAKFQHTSSKEEERQLDYFALKRFLLTAYNTLRDLDSKVVDITLTGILSNIREIESIYTIYKRSKMQPKVAFQNIFLKYTKYKEAKCRLEFNISEMNRLKGKADTLEEEIKYKTNLLKKVQKNDPRLLQAVEALKKMKRIFVDTIDNMGTIREENEKLVPITREYYDRFFEDFLEKFNSSYELNMKSLKQIIDSLTYTFDRELWQRAKYSKNIRNFFEQSNIEEDFSTLTFLKYYLRSLDQSKMSEEQRSLIKLKEYLERKNRPCQSNE